MQNKSLMEFYKLTGSCFIELSFYHCRSFVPFVLPLFPSSMQVNLDSFFVFFDQQDSPVYTVPMDYTGSIGLLRYKSCGKVQTFYYSRICHILMKSQQ